MLEAKQGEELIEIAQKKGKVLTVFCNRRWDSDFLTVRHLLNSNRLGQLFEYRARYDRFRPLVRQNRWKESGGPGSGTLWDLGSHLIDQALLLFGWPKNLAADVAMQRPGAKVVDYFHIQLVYPQGLRVNLSSSSLMLSPGPKYELHCEGGLIH